MMLYVSFQVVVSKTPLLNHLPGCIGIRSCDRRVEVHGICGLGRNARYTRVAVPGTLTTYLFSNTGIHPT